MAPRAPASVRTVYSILADPLILGTTCTAAVMSLGWYYYVSKKPSRILDQHITKKFKLVEKIKINHNTSLYRFALPKPTDVLGLPIGQHISVITTIDGEDVVRNYTPTTGNETKGYFDLVIKTYPEGNVSKYMAGLEPGDSISVQGPKGAYSYTPNTELDRLERQYADQFRVHHTLADPPTDWQQGVGFVTKDTLAAWMPAPADDIQLLLCGPPSMMMDIEKATTDLGYTPPRSVSKLTDQVFKF
ncbi:hypothetical protein [Absidia glauca]|uniref:cytochrome-b5 reductase n=1 Tax=Absidia glauca TaxID=4829 RepID=A0A168NEE1_ABSGL|nr:hypothetical protein [Absidia glauca]